MPPLNHNCGFLLAGCCCILHAAKAESFAELCTCNVVVLFLQGADNF